MIVGEYVVLDRYYVPLVTRRNSCYKICASLPYTNAKSRSNDRFFDNFK